MRFLYHSLFVVLFLLISCKEENLDSKAEANSPGIDVPLAQEYNWANYDKNDLFGEVLLVPVYSSVFHQSSMTHNLTATLSLHNADLNFNITILKIDYYDAEGNLLKRFIKDQLVLSPFQSKQFIIKESDVSGGTAAKFVIHWISQMEVTKPVVESVMISTSSQQGISFKTESRIISSVGY